MGLAAAVLWLRCRRLGTTTPLARGDHWPHLVYQGAESVTGQSVLASLPRYVGIDPCPGGDFNTRQSRTLEKFHFHDVATGFLRLRWFVSFAGDLV